MYSFAKNLLFRVDPELAHELSMDWLGAASRLKLIEPFVKRKQDPCTVMGIEFPNRVGLAAGLDKNADYVDAMHNLGFGFVEVGTVTPLAQAGNPPPRLFRLPQHQAIINRMGFNNKGVAHLRAQLKRRKSRAVVGVNIGKNKLSSEDDALQDYQIGMQAVYELADYITVNISSPNTPGLRNLQFGENLETLLAGVKSKQLALADSHQRYVPVAVKIAPDMTPDELKFVADSLVGHQLDGVVATNTSIAREGVEDAKHSSQAGGLSGGPLREKSTAVICALAEHLQGELPIIGVGGITSPQDAVDKMLAGASLVQIYSGLIYEGPALIYACADAIAKQANSARTE